MEILPKPLYQTLNKFWRRRRYKRLHVAARGRKKLHVTRFHGAPYTRKWRIRVPKRLRVIGIGALSPLKLWAKLKSGYINMMVNLAGNVGYLNTANVFGSRRIPKSRSQPTVVYSGNEIEQRLIVEIYKALQIVSANAHEVKPVN